MRAVGALAVAIAHFALFPPGWIGVQLFFVLSGFLITSILLRDKRRTASPALFFKRFYYRRSLRIFPLYYLYLAVVALICLAYRERRPTFHVYPYLLTYTYNWFKSLHFMFDNQMIGHLWSLAVEEQFYLFWPLLVWFLSEGSFRRLVIFVLLFSPLLRIAAWRFQGSPEAMWTMYHGTFFQMDGFAAGAALAVFPFAWIRNAKAAFWWVCLGIVTLAIATNGLSECWGFILFMPSRMQWLWAYSGINVASALAILSSVRGKPVLRLLQSRPMVHIGKVSYGFYVWHFLIQNMIGHLNGAGRFYRPGTLKEALACIAFLLITWLAATLSYNIFESQFLKWKDKKFAAPGVRQFAVN